MDFPPKDCGTWRPLDEEGRRKWLAQAKHNHFHLRSRGTAPRSPSRIVVLDGSVVDSELGFYCAFGEAVNGPGGYFGANLQAFDDCLFGGFGLDAPYTIVWKNSSASVLASSEGDLFEALVDMIRSVEERAADTRAALRLE